MRQEKVKEKNKGRKSEGKKSGKKKWGKKIRGEKLRQTGWLLLESWLNSNKRYDCFQKLLNSNKLYDFYFKDDYIPTKCVTFSFKITKFQQTVTFLAKITRFRQTVRLLLLKLLNFNKLCDFFQKND